MYRRLFLLKPAVVQSFDGTSESYRRHVTSTNLVVGCEILESGEKKKAGRFTSHICQAPSVDLIAAFAPTAMMRHH